MCTAITYKTKAHYFGRNLDYEFSYDERVTITPRNFGFLFRKMGMLKSHYAMIGMAYVVNDYPLYYDGTNERGVSMAGLLFQGNAEYRPYVEGKHNIAPFELIPWVLGQCASITEVKNLLKKINIWKEPFSKELPLSPLHWMISDKETSIVLEVTREGMKIYENPMGVLTNNPPFAGQMFHLNQFMNLSSEEPKTRFGNEKCGVNLKVYSRGMGAIGLPGDLSSMSRFVKAAFTRCNAVSGNSEMESVSQFFHILKSVEQQRGCVHMGNGQYELTIYSSCCNTDRGIYYYTMYENSRICAVDMWKENLDGCELICYPLKKEQDVCFQN